MNFSVTFKIFAFLFLFLTFNANLQAASPGKGVGVNVSEVSDWSTAFYFVDVMKMSRAWWMQPAGHDYGHIDDQETFPVDKNGWPTYLPAGREIVTTMFTDLKDIPYPSGVYNCFYEGKGELSFGGAAKIVGSKEGHLKIKVSPPGNILLRIVKIDPEDPIRNIRIIMPGYEETYESQPFYRPILDFYKNFNVIRFMNWFESGAQFGRENHTTDWASRVSKEYAHQTTDKGVAVEYMVELSNAVGSDPWVNIPSRATNDYVRNLAVYLSENLDSKRKIYIEYSNEIWNWFYPQYHHILKQGELEGLTNLEYFSKRTVEIFDIFEDVFGGTDRIVRVMSGMAGNAWVGKVVLSYNDAYKKVDAFTIAGYFGLDLNQYVEHDLSLLVKDHREHMREVEIPRIINNKKTVEKYRVPIIAYEGGQHITGLTEDGESCQKINNDNRMEETYIEFLRYWDQITDGGLFVHYRDFYKPVVHGCWGVKETISQSDEYSPKLRALMRHYDLH